MQSAFSIPLFLKAKLEFEHKYQRHIRKMDERLEQKIIASRLPSVDPELNRQLVSFVHGLRTLDLKKAPAISETIDWARSLVLLKANQLDRQLVRDTLNVLLKFEQDIEAAQEALPELLKPISSIGSRALN